MNRLTDSLRTLRCGEGVIMHGHTGVSPTQHLWGAYTATLWLRPVLSKVGAAILLVFT